jgi:polar amino acid transport system substrate-binding protein
MKKFTLILALCLTLVMAFSTMALAGPVLDRILKNKELVVGTNAGYPPFTVKTKDGKVIGLDMDLARGLADSLQVKLTIKIMPFPELLKAIEAGKVDLGLAGITMLPERNTKMAFVGPYFVTGQGVLLKATMAAAIRSIDDVDKPSITVAVAKGTTGEEAAKIVLKKAKIVAAPNMKAAVQMLLDGKANAVVTDFPYTALAAYRNPKAGLAALEKPFTYEPLGMAAPKGDALWTNLLRNFLGSLMQSGKLIQLQTKWFKTSGWMKQLPK